MTRQEAIKHVKGWIKQRYGRQNVLANERGMSKSALSHAVHSLSPWLIKESGLVKEVEVTYSMKEGV